MYLTALPASFVALVAALVCVGCTSDCSGAQHPILSFTVVDDQGHPVRPDAVQVEMPGFDEAWQVTTACTSGQSDVCTVPDNGGGPGTYRIFVDVGGQQLQRDVRIDEYTQDGCRLAAVEGLTLTLE